MLGDYLKFSLMNLRVRKLRTLLTMIGIFVGIAAVVALISLGQGLEESIEAQSEKVGTDKITINPGGVGFGPPGSAAGIVTTKLTKDDLEAIENVKGVKTANGLLVRTAKVEFKNQIEYISVWGFPTEPDSLKSLSGISYLDIGFGRELDTGDSHKAIIGYTISNDRFDKKIDVGDKISIDDISFDVKGIQEKIGTGIHDTIIRIPLDVSREIFDEPNEVSFLGVQVEKGYDTTSVGEEIKEELRKYRGLEEGEEDFTISTPEQIIDSFKTILNIVQVVLIGIAAISLIVGGIGIMNTMYTSVLEKTKEIGIMKAIGAKNSQVFMIFFIESGLLGAVGGAIGVIIGLGLSKTAELIIKNLGVEIFSSSFSPTLILGALIFSFLVGAISGVLPAVQASKLHPVEAIRKR